MAAAQGERAALKTAAQAAETAAARFTDRGQTDEAAVSRLMADRYRTQLTKESR